MRAFLFLLAGFIAALLSLTLFGSFAFVATAFLFAGALFFLFYSKSPADGYWLVGGIVLGLELLGTARPGQAALVGFILICCHHLFGQRLRFTSQLARFIVALLLLFITYNLILFSWQHFFTRLPSLLVLYIVTCLGVSLFASFQRTSDHEFI